MKTISLIFFLIGATASLVAQPNRPTYSAGNHATLDSIMVSYKSLSSDTQQVHAMYARPEMQLVLKANSGVQKIFIEVRNRQSQALLYAANYSLNAAPYQENGQVLFSGQGRRYTLLCPLSLPLSVYQYRIYTGDAQGNHSATFITRQ